MELFDCVKFDGGKKFGLVIEINALNDTFRVKMFEQRIIDIAGHGCSDLIFETLPELQLSDKTSVLAINSCSNVLVLSFSTLVDNNALFLPGMEDVFSIRYDTDDKALDAMQIQYFEFSLRRDSPYQKKAIKWHIFKINLHMFLQTAMKDKTHDLSNESHVTLLIV